MDNGVVEIDYKLFAALAEALGYTRYDPGYLAMYIREATDLINRVYDPDNHNV